MAQMLNLKTLSHHAYSMVGGAAEHDALVAVLAKDHKISLRGNPDFVDRRYEVFSVDDSREIKSLAESKPTVAGAKKIFVLEMSGITNEAQNALLKLLEEPPVDTHFFLIVSSAHLLLPTVKSRLSFLGEGTNTRKNDADLEAWVEKFIKSKVDARLTMAKAFNDEIAKEKRSKQDAVEVLNILEEKIHAMGIRGNVGRLEAVSLARKYSTDRAPSMKMLLDYVAMSLL